MNASFQRIVDRLIVEEWRLLQTLESESYAQKLRAQAKGKNSQ